MDFVDCYRAYTARISNHFREAIFKDWCYAADHTLWRRKLIPDEPTFRVSYFKPYFDKFESDDLAGFRRNYRRHHK